MTIDWLNQWIVAAESEFSLLDKKFYEKQAKITVEFSKSGRLGSGLYHSELLKTLDQEIESRASLLVELFNESLNAQAYLPDNALIDSGQFADGAIQKTYKHLYYQTALSFGLSEINLSGLRNDSELALSNIITKMKLKISNAGKLAMKKQNEITNHSTNVTIHGHGNAVQAGNYQSTIGLKFDSSTKQVLTKAIEDFNADINKSNVPAVLKAELIEVTADCQAELEKDSPNQTKLKGLLNGLATSIQTVASLKSAWEIFKIALATVGITNT